MCDQHRFAFNIAEAYREQAVAQFEASPKHPLANHGAPSELGVYALYLGRGSKPVYVGKATKISLARRLTEHARKIAGRQNISLDQVWCRYLVIGGKGEEWVASSAEASLIRHYEPEWQSSGFGSHVPGKGRPGIRLSSWDGRYPPRSS